MYNLEKYAGKVLQSESFLSIFAYHCSLLSYIYGNFQACGALECSQNDFTEANSEA